MKRQTIGISDAEDLDLQLITYFKSRFGFDMAIRPMSNINIGTKEKPILVDCDISKPGRYYDHFAWIGKLADQIEEDPDRIVYIVQNAEGERAVGVNRVTGTRRPGKGVS